MLSETLNNVCDSVDVLDRVLCSYKIEPVDLLGIGDGSGEFLYLTSARSSYERTIKDILSICGNRHSLREPFKVLEIGAYLGVVSLTLAELGFNVTALDIPEFMENAKLQARYTKRGVGFVSHNLANGKLPFPDASFDVVIMCETLEHLNFNPLPVLSQIHRVLRPGGGFYLSLPNLSSLVNRLKLLVGRSIHNPMGDFSRQLNPGSNMIVGLHWREYTRLEIMELLDLSGFEPVYHYYFVNTLSCFPARILYHIFPQLRPNQTVFAHRQVES